MCSIKLSFLKVIHIISLIIYLEKAYFPDAARDIQVKVEGVDKAYFQHAVLNVSWKSPESKIIQKLHNCLNLFFLDQQFPFLHFHLISKFWPNIL